MAISITYAGQTVSNSSGATNQLDGTSTYSKDWPSFTVTFNCIVFSSFDTFEDAFRTPDGDLSVSGGSLPLDLGQTDNSGLNIQP